MLGFGGHHVLYHGGSTPGYVCSRKLFLLSATNMVADGYLVLVRSSSVLPLIGVLGKTSELIRILNPNSILNVLCALNSS